MVGLFAGRLTDVILQDLDAAQFGSIKTAENPSKIVVVAVETVDDTSISILTTHFPDIPKVLLGQADDVRPFEQWVSGDNWEVKRVPAIYIQTIKAQA